MAHLCVKYLLSGATGIIWGKKQKTRDKCFFAALDKSTRSTTEKMLFQEDFCGSDDSKTYLTWPWRAVDFLWETVFAETLISCDLSDANWSCNVLSRGNGPSAKEGGSNCLISQGPSLVGHSLETEMTTEIHFLDFNSHKLIFNLMLQVEFI